MKSLSLLYLLFAAAVAVAAGEVVFVPGWHTANLPPGRYYETPLAEVYPGSRLTILKWNSNVKWFSAVDNADAFVPEIVKYLAEKSAAERAELTLIGHSLGGRIVIKAAAELTKKKMTVKRIVLLGAAIDCDVDLAPVVAASAAPVVNVFSEDDAVLKHGYPKFQCKCPLGFRGAENPPAAGFAEYRLVCLDGETRHIQKALDGMIWVHSAKTYLAELRRVVNGERTPYRAKYDYSKAEKFLEENKNFLTLPAHWGVSLGGGVESYQVLRLLLASIFPKAEIPTVKPPVVLDSHAEWKLVKMTVRINQTDRTFYFVVDQYGRIRLWNLIGFSIRRRFDKLKPLIVEKF